jgi:CheY-like chemotaxis protein/MinD-like ATPase involved in chromosome partitioning or flagellar assembly
LAGETILIVDDDKQVRELIAIYLHEEGYRTVLAKDGVAAMTAVGERLPDLVLADVNMPDMNGLELAQRLRSDPPTAGIPIIMLSALAQSKDVLAGYANGADEYATKPIELAVLLAKVNSLLSRRLGGAPDASPAGKVIAVMHAKGGVGTTTLAVNLAVSLAMGAGLPRVCLADLNPSFGNAAGHLGLAPSSSLAEALQAGDGQVEDRALDDLLMLHDSGVRLIVAGRRGDSESRVGPAMHGAILERLRQRFDYVVADMAVAPLTRAGSPVTPVAVACVVTSATRASLEATSELLGLLADAPPAANHQFLILDRPTVGLDLAEAFKILGRDPSAIIPGNNLFQRAADGGQPLVAAHRGHPAASHLDKVAESIRQLADGQPASPLAELSPAGSGRA